MASVRCVNCQVCVSVSDQQKVREVIFCPVRGQYRATAIFRSCDEFVEKVHLHSAAGSGAGVAL